MGIAAELAGLSKQQRTAIWASYLGWTLDAFDFFLMVFMIKAISETFGADVKAVSEALFFTLAARPAGALVFGLLAEKFGRRPVLMIVILLFSALSAASGFARTLSELLLLRGLFGFAMGGEWGIGASLAMESIPPRLRGPVSGLLQAGYPSGYLLASAAYFLFFDALGWRYMFLLGLLPAALVLFIRLHVEESPAYLAREQDPRAKQGIVAALAQHWKLAAYLVVLMTAFNFFSHGTQDLYPTFLQKQHGFDTHTVGLLTGIMNVGAIVGALSIGLLSRRIGRKKAILLAAALALPVIPLWAFSQTALLLGIGAFLIQFAVQGAWGQVPAHLNELSPPAVRAMFPGFVYQLGNLIASRNAVMQARIAESHGDNYALALALVAGVTALVLLMWAAAGPERSEGELEAG
ncbi:MFS transporter [Novosphingobium lentum]|uniref:MFS transporter n=1 Tax=Novosphingobium lentum TaxID=145287 RepID=UPI0008379B59|nr:MFS transporter [Novosphingobium lentum]